MSARGWWWQRFHPLWRALFVIVYFGGVGMLMVLLLMSALDDDESARQDAPAEAATEAEPAPVEELPAVDDEQLAAPTGAELYETHCSACHGSSLEGGIGPRLDAGSDAADLTDRRLVKRISEGSEGMPAFSETLSEDEIDQILGFIREEQNG
jgi:mono/diheme cytochrome c family protein